MLVLDKESISLFGVNLEKIVLYSYQFEHNFLIV